jgi:hypothetical protein
VDGALLHELRMPFGCWEAKAVSIRTVGITKAIEKAARS